MFEILNLKRSICFHLETFAIFHLWYDHYAKYDLRVKYLIDIFKTRTICLIENYIELVDNKQLKLC